MNVNSQDKSAVDQEPVVAGNLFSQPWWLDAVAPNAWSEVTIEKQGKLVARHPYVYTDTRMGLSVGMPMLTQTLGPWIDAGEGKRSKQLAKFKDLANELIEKLPEYENFSQNFSYDIDNWLPWYWKGFQQTTRYTYVLDDLTDEEVLWSNLATNIRSDIRKAGKQVEVTIDSDIEDFFELNKKVFERQGKKQPYTREFIERLDATCSKQKQRAIFVARDSAGNPHAGAYIVWDKQSAYYIMGGGDPALRSSGATSLCMWEAIKYASQVSQKFDFEGSMIEPVERFFRAFGAKAMPYYAISKCSRKWQTAQHVRGSIKCVKSGIGRLFGKRKS